MRMAFRFAVLIAAAVAVGAAALSAGRDGQLLYRIDETAAGSRSQGWHGTLFDASGARIALAEGQKLKTPAGGFVGVACVMPWRPCGAILQEMLPSNGIPENIITNETWSYRITVASVGSRSEGTHGELLRDGIVVQPDDKRTVKTPMGVFVWAENENLWGSHGWYFKM